MGLCDGYCVPPGEPGRYRAAIEQAVLILEGKFDQLRRDLEAEMEQAAEELRFERAAELRDRLRAVESLGKQQHVVAGTRADTDVIGFFRGEVKSCLAVLCYVGGDLVRRDAELFDTPAEEEPEELLSMAVSLYYLGRNRFPKEVLLPQRIGDSELIERMLAEKAGRKVSLLVPERGAKKALVALAEQNAADEAERATSGEERTSRLLLTLQKLLDLERPPMRIEAFDISHTAGEEMVASMAVFADARPLKRDYRRFRIKTLQGQDDYGAMEEVLTRRIRRLKSGEENFGPAPDLLLIDGGAAHANVAGRVLEQESLHIPVFGMVKDDRHRTRPW
jgi:excinuclease ABC subunit C